MKQWLAATIVNLILGLTYTLAACYAVVMLWGWAVFWQAMLLGALAQGWYYYSLWHMGHTAEQRDLDNAVHRNGG